MKIVFPLLILIIALQACKINDNNRAKKFENKIQNADWLLGSWQNNIKDGVIKEGWKKESDSVFLGESFVLNKTDTVFHEFVRLHQIAGNLFYTVSVKGNNNSAPVSFRLTEATDTSLVFENPAHDFPSKINYTKISTDSIYAEISGVQNGQQVKEAFPYKRE